MRRNGTTPSVCSTSSSMNNIRLILQEKLPLSDCTISKPQDGQQKECYIAHSDKQSVFIKFDVPLSDPLRDSGLLLWWYVKRENWPPFFQAYGLHCDDLLLERLFWWTARTSLAIALWQVAHKQEPTNFLQDFLAALHREDIPHGAS